MPYEFDLEARVIRQWIVPQQQERFLACIRSPKSRPKFLAALAHGVFRTELLEPCPTESQLAARVRPFADCYLLSTDPALDGRRLPTAEALAAGLRGWADQNTLLVFGAAAVLYVETEGRNARWVSRADGAAW
ncbi:hypothetical protein EJV47_20510 [Hymenobacter gummosus]|uniref:Uncharacterized protein n=1 Tax=Hymenobacter gummosus TaxID=1776032 RepID=A0A3S0IKP7_9BACT|nr:hypothetical protein [Hymenobacter gummosus]RTQ46759.1 hypothetical protein EJV47_20510 [Hymenobacter gummosus]